MAEDKKVAGQKPRQEACRDSEADEATRKRAPDQDVLPGILGKQLKAAYSELLNAPIPDAFSELIKRLENEEPAQHPVESPRREESKQ
jgi:hypothetical protein